MDDLPIPLLWIRDPSNTYIQYYCPPVDCSKELWLPAFTWYVDTFKISGNLNVPLLLDLFSCKGSYQYFHIFLGAILERMLFKLQIL